MKLCRHAAEIQEKNDNTERDVDATMGMKEQITSYHERKKKAAVHTVYILYNATLINTTQSELHH